MSRKLNMVPVYRDDDGEPETPDAATGTGETPEAAGGTSLTAAEVMAEHARRLFRVLGASAPKRGTLLHDALNYSGDSFTAHIAWIRSRAWVAKYKAQGSEGKGASRIGAIHGYTIGAAGNLLANGIKAATKQAEVFWLLVAPLTVLIFCIVWFTG